MHEGEYLTLSEVIECIYNTRKHVLQGLCFSIVMYYTIGCLSQFSSMSHITVKKFDTLYQIITENTMVSNFRQSHHMTLYML